MVDLLSAADRFAALDRSSLAFDSDRCLHSLDKFNECDRCFALCPVDAITAGQPPVVDEDQCQHCFACLVTCPVGAYRGSDSVQALLTCASRLDVTSIEVYCQFNTYEDTKASQADASIRVHGCLAGLGTGAYLMLRALGVENVLVRQDACDDCPWASLIPRIDEQLNQAELILGAWGYGEAETPADGSQLLKREAGFPIWDADNPPLTRRGLFKMLTHQGQGTLARLAQSADAPAQRKPALNQLRMSHAIELLGIEAADAFTRVPSGSYFADLQVSDDCTACGTCVKICPTEALQLVKEQEGESESFRLEFMASLCIGCQACVHACYPDAIQVEEDPSIAELFVSNIPRVLREGILRECQKCFQPFAPKADECLCPICEFRQKNPLGGQIPPGLHKHLSA